MAQPPIFEVSGSGAVLAPLGLGHIFGIGVIQGLSFSRFFENTTPPLTFNGNPFTRSAQRHPEVGQG